MPLRNILSKIGVEEVKKSEPEVYENLLDLCKSLDPSEHPEVKGFISEKYKTFSPFSNIYSRLLVLSKRRKGLKKKLSEAEKVILGLAEFRKRIVEGKGLKRRVFERSTLGKVAAKHGKKIFDKKLLETAQIGVMQKVRERIASALKEAERLVKKAEDIEKEGDVEKAKVLYEKAAEIYKKVYKSSESNEGERLVCVSRGIKPWMKTKTKVKRVFDKLKDPREKFSEIIEELWKNYLEWLND